MPRSSTRNSSSRSLSRSPRSSHKYHSYKSKPYHSYSRHDSRGYYPKKKEYWRSSRSRSSSQSDRYERSHNKIRRRNSRSRTPSPSKKIVFDFEVFIETPYINLLSENNNEIINKILDTTRINCIEFDHQLTIPGAEGSVIKISDESYSKKYSALLEIVNEIEVIRNSKREHSECSLVILVPEGMVSLLIGTKGKQIRSIMKDSRTQIVVNPAVHQMTYRSVKINGRPINVVDAVRIIYQTLEDISPHVEKIEKTPKPIEPHKTKITAKLVFPEISAGFIMGKEGSWIKDLCEKCSVSIKLHQDGGIRCVRRDEVICDIRGKLAGVINAVVIILRRSQESESSHKSQSSDLVKLLIPNNFVTKLIGAKGCMIREIAAKAGGAQIKIMSDKQSEREHQDCVVTIAGSLANKQDAVCYILEQIEIFKNGGPILMNGKAINENSAQQFRNSILPRDTNDLEQLQQENEIMNEENNQNNDSQKMETENPESHQNSTTDGKQDKILSPQKSTDQSIVKSNEGPENIKEITNINDSPKNRARDRNSISRSRSRSKSISIPRSSNNNNNGSKNRYSRSKSPSKSHSNKKQSNAGSHPNNSHKDAGRNCHFIDKNGETKIATTFVVPSYLVPYLTANSWEIIDHIEATTSTQITFRRESDSAEICTVEGVKGRLATITGSLKQVLDGCGQLMEEIMKLEREINGVRDEKDEIQE